MQNFKKWLPAVSIAALIFILSSVPGATIKENGLNNEYLNINAHFFLYMILAICIYKPLNTYHKALALTMLYALSDEIHQLYVPGRSFQYKDLLIDLTGATLGLLILWIIKTLPNKTWKKLP